MSQPNPHSLDPRPHIIHVVFRLDCGGLENGLINLINGMVPGQFRHTIIALTQASDFKYRLRGEDTRIYALNKRPGKDLRAYVRLYRLLRTLRPDVIHTRNIGTMDCVLVAGLAGVPRRIHGEHGWDVHDPDGTRAKYRAVRRLLNPMIDHFVVVSRELEQWLTGSIGIDAPKVQRICNGVDTLRFRPRAADARGPLPAEWRQDGVVVFGTVSRLSAIKDPLNLVRAFIEVGKSAVGSAARLLIVGDGELKSSAEQLLRQAGLLGSAWLPGARDDIPELLRAMDVFVLASRREGISNTVLEAMASGLPVIASATGGNLELVRDGISGRLVAPGDSTALAGALVAYLHSKGLRAAHGNAARKLAEREHSLQAMIREYGALYERFTARARESC